MGGAGAAFGADTPSEPEKIFSVATAMVSGIGSMVLVTVSIFLVTRTTVAAAQKMVSLAQTMF